MKALLFGLLAMAFMSWLITVTCLIVMTGYAGDFRYGIGGLVLFGAGMAVLFKAWEIR